MIWRKLATGIVAAVAAVASAHALAGELRAGAAKESITPPAEVFPYRSGNNPPVVGVHDPVFARALVLDDGTKRLVLVSLDAVRVPGGPAFVARIAEAAGIPPSQVLVSASHTHNSTLIGSNNPGPNEQREIDRVEAGALAAVRAAIVQLRPARISGARGSGWINVNNGEQAGRSDGYDPIGISDKTLDVVRVEDAAGAPLALLVSYANHGEVMFKAITRDGGVEVSGDLAGAVSALLEGQGGDKGKAAPVVLFAEGAAGDQLTQLRAIEQASTWPARDYGAAGWAMLDAQARRLALSVGEVLKAMPPASSTARLGAASGSATCPGQKTRQDRETGAITTEPQPPVTIPLTLLKVGNISFAGIGADIASEIGIALRKAMPRGQNVLVTMAAGSVGYVLADASYDRPGHAVFGSRLAPGCAQRALINAFAQLGRQAAR